MRLPRLLLLAVTLALLALPAAAQPVGVVMMHGKWGMAHGATLSLETALRQAGHAVVARDMPWSNTRAYDRSVEEAMREIDARVAELKAMGATVIVVGGHSLGANMALAYAVRHPEVRGLLLLAPGHTPERMARNPRVGDSVAKARELVAQGKGNEPGSFNDLNQDRERKVPATAAIYLSYFDPQGAAVMPLNTPRVGPGTAVLWVVGRQDPLYREGAAYGFDRLPKNPLNAFRTVESDHISTPNAARQIVIDWLGGLR